ncbi:MAG: transglutaminase-like domain-containing protein [Pseudomonadota bacterium]
MSRRPRAWLALIFVPCLIAAEPAPATRSERFTLYIAGERVGRLVAIDRVLPDGTHELVRESQLALRRGSTEVRMSSQAVTLLDSALKPLRYRYLRDEGGGAVRARGEVKGRQVLVTTEAGGATTTRTIDMDEGVTFAAALELQQRRRLKDGDTFSGKVLLEELGAVVDASYRSRATAEGFVVESSIAGVQQVEHLDRAGKTLRVEIPALGAYAVPEGAAPPPLTTSLDVLARTVWDAPEDFPPRGQLARALFRVDGTLNAPVPEDRFQRVLKREGGHLVVEVKRQAQGPVEKLSAADRKQYLAETPYEAIHDPRIVQVVKELTHRTRSPQETVERLTRFVFDRVEQKDLSRAYAPATETLETRIGDCTEHSVLFSALAKAAGIPTRLADGVVVADGRVGYHEWVEVYLDGEGWRPVDPTFGEPHAGPNRLKLAQGTSQPEELLRMGLSAASALTGLKISVIAHDRITPSR